MTSTLTLESPAQMHADDPYPQTPESIAAAKLAQLREREAVERAILHVIEVVGVDGEYWPRCSCRRWIGLPHSTYWSAKAATCAIEAVELDNLRALYLFRRACERENER
jgi:hypothetical protein